MKETSHKNSLWLKSYIQNSEKISFFSIQSDLSTFKLWLLPNYCELFSYPWLTYVKPIIGAGDQNLLTGTKCDVYTLFFFSLFTFPLFSLSLFSFLSLHLFSLSLSLSVSLLVVVDFGCGFVDFGYGSGGDWFWFWLSFVSLAVGLVVVIDFAILVVGFLDFDGGGG